MPVNNTADNNTTVNDIPSEIPVEESSNGIFSHEVPSEIYEFMLNSLNINENFIGTIYIVLSILLLILLCFVGNYLTKRIIVTGIHQYIKRSKNQWDDILLTRKVFNRLSHLAPAGIIYFTLPLILNEGSFIYLLITIATKVYALMIVVITLDSLLSAINDIYEHFPSAKNKPIKSYLQVVKIFAYFITGIIILAIVFDKSLVYFFSGLGALAAVLMLIFKDSILGLVAGVQLTSNNMVKIGDWIAMPKHNADGNVIEVTLNTVKVQNWDKTITTIPTYALIAESFTNWRGMEESGGRRIKRSITIDLKSIQFCSDELLEKLKKIHLLKDYIEEKQAIIQAFNEKHNIDKSIAVNGRSQTNIGIFRRYLEMYLKANENISQEMTFLVRQLQPTEKGLPIEIYVFSTEQAWVIYEGVQADIFDHIFAVIPEFELKAFQLPTGEDFKRAFTGINT